jgi:dodecin
MDGLAKFEKHLFISYAHIDNQPLSAEQQGWVSRFHASLRDMFNLRTPTRLATFLVAALICYSDSNRKGVIMSVARISEISSTSEKSFEDAVQQGIQRATATLRNVRSAWIKEQEVQVEGNRITAYKVIMKVTFVLE